MINSGAFTFESVIDGLAESLKTPLSDTDWLLIVSSQRATKPAELWHP